MMRFRQVKTALLNILGNAAAGRYRIIGFQRQEKAAEEFIDNNRLVEVYYRNSNIDKGKGRVNGPVDNMCNFSVELTVSAPSKVDLSIINDPNSTPAQIQTAMAGFKEASDIADDQFDELVEIVFQILMDARNFDLGLNVGEVANRWISQINKNDPNPRGDLVVLTGTLEYTCSVSEDILGDTGQPLDQINLENEINQDTVQKTGVVV